ncbi:hypothetical protein CPB85DRAFT_1521256, partial [Mucidula mucida]
MSRLHQPGRSYNVHFHSKTKLDCLRQNPRIERHVRLQHTVIFQDQHSKSGTRNCAYCQGQKVTLMELHHICGHRDPASLRRMYIDGHIEGIKLDLNSKAKFCEICAKAKAKRKPFPKEGHYEYVQGAGDKVVTDLIGPMDVKSLGGARYACTFRD